MLRGYPKNLVFMGAGGGISTLKKKKEVDGFGEPVSKGLRCPFYARAISLHPPPAGILIK